ncbi:hypothetical protein PAXRUDRAFT_825617 [Paxillus rubicundulus Ve08.2h10]|uniref:Fungal lipase-type domain-containing protein n=1 Tax=Paxillus rubicundulus Ve08.2h10 TaxID=930991 RepID=A0A0D0DG19_9AGAM|nr:hypothetical protein PAXRUDRAFT_825617 [Paxillus rubicundulus Ve08.2h10]
MSFDSFQQVFALSLYSNLVNGQKGIEDDLQRALQYALAQELPKFGNWSTVWGPTVWKFKPADENTGPDNSWFVGYNPSLAYADGSIHPTYVVAIAGTPLRSNYAWFQENLAVNRVADFNAWVASGFGNPPEVTMPKDIVPSTPYTSIGTVNALHTLLTKHAPLGSGSAGITLLDFLVNLDRSNSPRVVFTGSSLGAALASTLALSLVLAGVVPASSALTYLTAGPSPGNRIFADLFASTFPAQRFPGSEAGGYQVWNLNIVNSLDIVPQAWCVIKSLSPEQNLGNIPGIYGPPPLPLIQGITLLLKIFAFSSGVIYIPLQSHILDGVPPASPPATLAEFLDVAFVQQHIGFYVALLRVSLPTLTQFESFGLVKKTEAEHRYEYPIIGNLEYAVEHPEDTQRAIDDQKNTPDAEAVGGL